MKLTHYISSIILIILVMLALGMGKRVNESKITDLDQVLLFNLMGETVSLSDKAENKPMFLNFFATWCPACQSERATIDQLNKYMKNKDIKVFTIDMRESVKHVSEFMAKNNYSFPVFIDVTGELAHIYNVRSIPTTVLVNSDGTVEKKMVGALNWMDPKMLDYLNVWISKSK